MNVSYSPFLRRLFNLYLKLKLRRYFQKVVLDTRLTEQNLRSDLPVIWVANHLSWWDGFLIAEAQRKLLPNAFHYTLMLEHELSRFPFFRKLGGLGITPHQGSSVAHAFGLLKMLTHSHFQTSIAFFPQGEIVPSLSRPVVFKKGIELFIRTLGSVQIIPVGLHLEPMNTPLPSAFVWVGKPLLVVETEELSAEYLAGQVELLLEEGAKFLSAALRQEI